MIKPFSSIKDLKISKRFVIIRMSKCIRQSQQNTGSNPRKSVVTFKMSCFSEEKGFIFIKVSDMSHLMWEEHFMQKQKSIKNRLMKSRKF